jgi:GT2 family glycosyltransferase
MESTKARSKVTVLIKALNEETRIAACLEAAIREARSVSGDVLLVDSLSDDRTVEIARQFPVRIVQFSKKEDCSCGAATQLGYQWADADFVYVLDADMVLSRGFLATALEALEKDQSLGGVGGKLIDLKVNTIYDKRRVAAAAKLNAPIEVEELGGGGLYRRAAIEQVGYLSNRWLAAFEEADLGMRLRSHGWRLLRLPAVSVEHEGHQESNISMLMRLWKNGRAQATGALIRSAFFKPWFVRSVRKNGYVFIIPFFYLLTAFSSLLLGLAGAPWGGGTLACLAFFLIALAIRKRSVSEAISTFLVWHFFFFSAAFGLLKKPGDPKKKIDSVMVKEVV